MSTGWIRRRLEALRAFSFPVSALPVLVGAAAASSAAAWRWDVLVVSVLGAVALHGAGNLFNDYFDFRKGVDRRVEDDEGRPGRLLVRGALSPAAVLQEAFFCATVGALCGVYIILRCGGGIVLFGIAAAAGLYAYTGPPFYLKYRALGEVVVFIVFGPLLVVGAAFAQTGRVEWGALLFSIPVGLVTTAILVGNNLRDEQEDRQARITTLTHAIGSRAGRMLYGVLIVGAIAVVTAFGLLGWGGWAFCFAPVLLALVEGPLRNVLRGRRLPDIDVRTAKFETAFLVFLIVVLVVQGPLMADVAEAAELMEIEAASGSVSIPATVHAKHYEGSRMPWHHLVTWRRGRAGKRALLVSPVSDKAVLDALVSLGARPGDNLHADAWEKLEDPGAPEPDVLAKGPPIEVTVQWEGLDAPVPLRELFVQEAREKVSFCLAGNERWIERWHSGCIVCAQSCPGAKIANAAVPMRTYLTRKDLFSLRPGVLPPDGTEVTVTFRIKETPPREDQP